MKNVWSILGWWVITLYVRFTQSDALCEGTARTTV